MEPVMMLPHRPLRYVDLESIPYAVGVTPAELIR